LLAVAGVAQGEEKSKIWIYYRTIDDHMNEYFGCLTRGVANTGRLPIPPTIISHNPSHNSPSSISLGLTLSEEKNRPVTKVITLLKDMQKQLQAESEADQEIYDKLACWCTTNDKAKTKVRGNYE
jgi:hypothetical protein